MIYMIEGEWTGYRPSQQKIVHREYTKDRKWADSVANLAKIVYSDGTLLLLAVTPLEGRKREPELNGYGELIRDCLRNNVTSVNQLIKIEESTHAQASSHLPKDI